MAKKKAKELLETPFRTYLQIAYDLFETDPDFYTADEKDAILSFAKYLDSGRVLNAELQMIAMQQARKIDGEVIMLTAERFGRSEVAAIVREVYDRHGYGKRKKID